MAVTILPVLLVAMITRCKCEATSGYQVSKGASQFGELLKPPPPPPQSQIVPVPFHGGAGRLQRQNFDVGYNYQPPPPPPPPPSPSNDFKFPAPFYKQYNFNFVPPPQPFTTTPSPSLFQKVSGWLFSSQQTNYNTGSQTFSNSLSQVKKDCNPCNLVPWIPVIRYNLGAKNVYQNSNPTYGPPSPTAYAHMLNYPQPFQNVPKNIPQLSPGVPHAVYGPPSQFQSSTVRIATSTYGPPSPTHTLAIHSQNTIGPTHSQSNTLYPTSSLSNEGLSSSYGLPSISSSSYSGIPSTTYGTPTSTYSAPSSSYGTPHVSSTYGPVTPHYEPDLLNTELQRPNEENYLKSTELSNDLQLPKVTHPAVFKNSYGEPITNALDIPYPVSATAAESTKIKTEVLPNDNTRYSIPNVTLALSNPAPFTLNRGRNIHTLQPVALPNLSVSPLPPIFNARPFRALPKLPSNVVQGVNSMQKIKHNVDITPSVPVVEFTHSIDYPASIIQSPIIDIDTTKHFNQTKSYRNIPNGFIVDEFKDISSQASEDHLSATKSIPDSSFESTGVDGSNDLYDVGLPSDFRPIHVPSNHKPDFADLRGVKDEDVDKYRTESNLQNIDSPLLYLKPSAPHKDHGKFKAVILSTPGYDNDYEIYDDIKTTPSPQSTLTSAWDESRNDYNQGVSLPNTHENAERPKIVQIIVPYTTTNEGEQTNTNFEDNPNNWYYINKDEYQGRKIPSHTETSHISTVTDGFNSLSTTTEEPISTVTESFEPDGMNAAAILNDLYDVKEPPFDIIKLQHTIDDWTEQEYSMRHKTPQKSRGIEKYAKQIPDDFFTTTIPSNYVPSTNNYNYEFYDHEGSSSIQHTVTEVKNNTSTKPRKQYNVIERTKSKYDSAKNEEPDDIQKLHIYTAASTFRSTSTTPAPWGKIQTSISPLTKEKVYVVTSKPWRETRNITNEWFDAESFEFKKLKSDDSDPSASDNFPFKSPRFSNRPSYGFTSVGKTDPVKADSSYGFSKSWYQSINDLENREHSNDASLPEGFQLSHYTNQDEVTTNTTTAEHHSDDQT